MDVKITLLKAQGNNGRYEDITKESKITSYTESNGLVTLAITAYVLKCDIMKCTNLTKDLLGREILLEAEMEDNINRVTISSVRIVFVDSVINYDNMKAIA